MFKASKRAKVCPRSHKQGYRTKSKALKFAERSGQIARVQLYTYRCRHCELWHLTSQVERSKAAA
jgi:hypothetical protein